MQRKQPTSCQVQCLVTTWVYADLRLGHTCAIVRQELSLMLSAGVLVYWCADSISQQLQAGAGAIVVTTLQLFCQWEPVTSTMQLGLYTKFPEHVCC